MTLSEFIHQKMEEENLKPKDFLDAGIGGQTWYNIMHDKVKFLMPTTMDKLARVMNCSKGDIQGCMAKQPNPLREEAARPEGQAGISITAKAKTVKKVAPAPDPKDEEPAEVFQTEDEPFPVYHSVYEEDRKEGEERYKQKLRDMCLRIFSSGLPGVHTMEKIYADIGYALVKELAKGGETDEVL